MNSKFPRMTIPYRGDKYTGRQQMIYGQYVYELDRPVKGVAGKRYWTHCMPSTAARQGIIPLEAPAAPQSGSAAGSGVPQFSRFADLKENYKLMFYGLANALSPENLAGDGEYSRAQIIVRKKRLLAEWRKLEKEVGFKVSISDAENYNPRERI